MPQKFKAFTLVELIVVITILAILGTIGFLSYTSYLVGARDSNRVTQLQDISNGLSMYSVKSTLPLPDSYVMVKASGSTIAYQGYMGQSQLDLISYSKGGKDPRDQEYFTYYLSADQKQFQLLGFLEDANNQTAGIFPSAYAADYTNRYITTIGKKLGVLTEAVTNQPIQAVSSIVVSGGLDTVTTTNSYTAWFSDKTSVAGTGMLLGGLQGVINGGKGIATNCKNYLLNNTSLAGKDGLYLINPIGTTFINSYCDMTTDGGGWTLVLLGSDTDIVLYDARGNSQWTTTNTIPFQSSSQSFKFSDSLINSIRTGSGVYRVNAQSNYGTDTFYVPSTCNYTHTLGNNGDCGKLYRNITFTNAVSCSASSGWNGIGCRAGVITNYGDVNHLVCYSNTFGGWCTNNGENIKVRVYVK